MKLTRALPVIALISFLTVCSPELLIAWGNEGHTEINRVAATKIPKDMPQFMRKATDRIAYLGPEPDRWREKSEFALKNAQEPDHFLDMDRVDDIVLPEGRYQFYPLLEAKRARMGDRGKDYLPENVGLQPYIAMEVFGRLKVAFREYRKMKAEHKKTAGIEQNIVFYAGWLGHYVGDASQPLHATEKYNGWVGPNPNGYTTAHQIHWQFEGLFVRENFARLKFDDLVKGPTQLRHPFKDYIDYLGESRSLTERVYQFEKEKALVGGGTPESIHFVKERLAKGAQMLLNMWYTAWIESATPVPPYVPPKPDTSTSSTN